MENTGFYKLILPLEGSLFQELSGSVEFEDVTKGRKGNHLVRLSDDVAPIVRTTTKYNKPAHNFAAIHDLIIENINGVANNQGGASFPPLLFNNALIEVYNRAYVKMKYHSDQCLDLEESSYIALFSCYEQPNEVSPANLRKLKVRDKISGEEFEFTLENNSVILFSLTTNTRFQHKIVLDINPNQKALGADNQWLGITFRKSKTFIYFEDDLPYFADGTLLKLADDAQRKEFYKLRGQENREMDFTYPDIVYTLSISDTMMPKDG